METTETDKETINKVEAEVMQAYEDCNCKNPDQYDYTNGKRNLNFKASVAVPRDEAVRIMGKAIPGGYNEFDANLLKKLPPDSMVTIAREGSVCIYVTPELGDAEALNRSLKCDEFDNKDGATRIWWD